MSTWSIRTLGPDDELAATGLLAHLNPDQPSAVLIARYREILAAHPHYLPLGGFEGDRIVALAGAWIATKIWCGRYLEVDNLVVHPSHRGHGYGSRMMEQLEQIARERECNLMVLDSYTSNYSSHRLYHRLGYEIWGFHFVKELASIHR